MRKIIVPTGYMGSGSSAVTDLVAEFKDCQNDYGDYEYIFLHSPNGLFDLEDKLLYGNTALRSDEAIRTFKTHMQKLYDKKFWWVGNYKKIIGPKFMDVTNEYINSLIDFNVDSYYYMHEEPNSKVVAKLLMRKPVKMLSKNKNKFKPVLRYNDGVYLSFPTKEEFYKKSHDYIYNVLDLIGEGNLVLDQLLVPFNLYRVDNYFDNDLKVIVVERDPRDVFIINKYVWPSKNLEVPMPKDVHEFCKYYKKMRESEIKTKSNKVLRIKFEDLIYKYDDEVKKIMKFLDFKEIDHINKKKRFIPELSIKNTQLFNDDRYIEEIKIVEKELKDYLYKFPYKLENKGENTIEFQ